MSIKRQALWHTFGIFVTLASDWLIIMLLPMLFSYSDSGLYSLAFSMCSIFKIVAMFSTRNYQVVSNYKEVSEPTFFSFRLYSSIFALLICCIFCFIMRYDSKTIMAVVGYMIGEAIIDYAEVMYGTIQLMNRLDIHGKISIFHGIVRIIIFYFCISLTGNIIISIICMQVVSGVLYFALTYVAYWRLLGVRPPYGLGYRDKYNILIKYCTPLMIMSIIPIIINALPKMYLGIFSTTEDIGLFSTATSLTTVVPVGIQFLFAPMTREFGELCEKNHKNVAMRKLVRCYIVFSTICVLVGVAIGVMFNTLFPIVYGTKILQYKKILYISMFSMSIYSLTTISIPMMIALKKNTEMIVASLSVCLFAIVCTYLLTNRKLALGASVGLFISYAIYFVLINCLLIRRNEYVN